jgi:hypothetical protein
MWKLFALTHTHTHMRWDSLDEGSARREELYLSWHNADKRQPSRPPARFEPLIPTSERTQTHALGRAATGIG